MMHLFFDEARYPEEAAALRALDVPASSLVLGIDLTAPADGLAALVAARRAGKTTAVFPILPEPFEETVRIILRNIAAMTDLDQRGAAFEGLFTNTIQVNGKAPTALTLYDKTHVDALALALRLADVVLVGAAGERDRYARLLDRPLRRIHSLAVPPVEERSQFDESGITIYAPSTPRSDLLFYEPLFAQRALRVSIISSETRDAVPQTRVVIAPEWRSLRARTLAARGHHVVAPNAARVDESDARIFAYIPTHIRSFYAAVDAARSASPATRKPLAAPPNTLAGALEAESARVVDGERISIVVRTFDRPGLLRRAVASIAAQSYRNVEIVVVNNGGSDVENIVAEAAAGRTYRYVSLGERKHISTASNAGARAATGAFVGYLDDDDLLYADHCARTVDVLERSKADVAFTLCVGEYADMTGGTKRLIGYQIYLDREYDPDHIRVSNLSPIHSIVHRRDLFDRFGYFDESLPVTDDWELWLRAASMGANFVRIDRATCEYSWRYDPERGNMTIEYQSAFVDAYKEITGRHRAYAANRPVLQSNQGAALQHQQQRAADAADPAKRASVVISAMSSAVVTVTPIPELLS
jgi:hypothetical protein